MCASTDFIMNVWVWVVCFNIFSEIHSYRTAKEVSLYMAPNCLTVVLFWCHAVWCNRLIHSKGINFVSGLPSMPVTRWFFSWRPRRRRNWFSRPDSKHTKRITIAVRILGLQIIRLYYTYVQYNNRRLKKGQNILISSVARTPAVLAWKPNKQFFFGSFTSSLLVSFAWKA